MLIRFNVSNFLSFNEETEFNMLTGSARDHKHHVYSAGKLDVLKSAAIYGANGAGKSNLIKAIKLLQDSVANGHIPRFLNNKKFKLNKENEKKSTSLEIEFSTNNKIYSYGVSFNNNIIEEEWLYESGITVEDKLIFERKRSTSGISIKMAEKHQKTQKSKLLVELMEESLLASNELLLSKSDKFKIEEITNVKEWIEDSLVIIFPESKYSGLVPNLSLSKKFKRFANELLETFDTGVSALDVETTDFEKFFGEEDEDFKNELIEQMEDGSDIVISAKGGALVMKEKNKYVVKSAIALHRNNHGEDISFDLDEESDGTQRLLDFIPAFATILHEEKTYLIDEIDQSLHPVLLYSLIKKIMDDETTKGQFIFTTHESNLLDLKIFRQDEIWFVEKEKKTGSTQFYPLSEFKPRNDLDIRKGYLNGRFGAIPFLAHLDDLNWHTYGA